MRLTIQEHVAVTVQTVVILQAGHVAIHPPVGNQHQTLVLIKTSPGAPWWSRSPGGLGLGVPEALPLARLALGQALVVLFRVLQVVAQGPRGALEGRRGRPFSPMSRRFRASSPEARRKSDLLRDWLILGHSHKAEKAKQLNAGIPEQERTGKKYQ